MVTRLSSASHDIVAARYIYHKEKPAEQGGSGDYVIEHGGLSVTEQLDAGSVQVTELGRGVLVRTLQVEQVERLVRGRISDPSGWISLSSLDGQVFAKKRHEVQKVHQGKESWEKFANSQGGGVKLKSEDAPGRPAQRLMSKSGNSPIPWASSSL